jgi:hypothetical protein
VKWEENVRIGLQERGVDWRQASKKGYGQICTEIPRVNLDTGRLKRMTKKKEKKKNKIKNFMAS